MKATQDYPDLPHILIVDDDARIRQLICRYLMQNDFVAFSASDASVARSVLEDFIFDAMILDVMMPTESGLSLARALRAHTNPNIAQIPILFLSALGQTEDKISGLQTGADDYLVKPFEPQELVLRLRAILRRHTPYHQNTHKTVLLRFGLWHYNPEFEGLIHTQTQEKRSLTGVEITLLRGLSARMGQVMTRDDLAQLCGLSANPRSVDVQITRLRRKIEEDPRMPRYLKTVRGQGYVLRAEYHDSE